MCIAFVLQLKFIIIMMKKKCFWLFCLFVFGNLLCFAEKKNIEFTDTLYYKGELDFSVAQKLILTLRIMEDDDSLAICFGSPLQTDDLIKASKAKIIGDSVKFNIKDIGVKFRGRFVNGKNEVEGDFSQGFLKKKLMFYRTDKLFTMQRVQTPKSPYSYNVKELTFENPQTNYVFHGTLTYPKDTLENDFAKMNVPVVVMVSGSGTQNRDEEIYRHKPFAVIADYLAKNGIACFRYDDRGYGSSDTNLYRGTTEDFMKDARCAINMLQNNFMSEKIKVFVLGHSEGGLIAEMLAAKYDDIEGIILMAAPAVSGKNILKTQTEALLNLNGIAKDSILLAIKEIDIAKFDTNTLNGYWLKYFYNSNPKDYLEKINCRVLVLQGEKDMQVLKEPNIKEMQKYLGKKAIYKIYPNLNHLFQQCSTGSPLEYSEIEQTICPKVLEDITNFIKENDF